ncbi:MAG: DNA mismatch repair endonuclease MutL [Anaerofustis sp.]
MNHIELLTKELVDKIAAGEVVVNGASVLKELIENSIDANSKMISIITKNGGKSLIKVVDNGDGIYKEDIQKAFLRNATSKITSSLDSIGTLGFRGEALASISFAADISVITKTADQQTGIMAHVLQNKIISQNEISCNKGTVIEVRDLFRTIPARFKYLKKDQLETIEIIDVATKIALAHPETSIKLECDGKEIFYTSGNADILSCMNSVLGSESTAEMICVDIDDAPLFVHGYTSSSNFITEKRFQHIVLNGRYIHSGQINRAIDQTYKEYYGKSGASFLLYIQIPYHMVDVNVHPAKLEVKLLNESLILMLIKQGIRDALKKEFLLKEPSQNKVIYTEVSESEPVIMEEIADYIPKKMVSTQAQAFSDASFADKDNELNSANADQLETDEPPFIHREQVSHGKSSSVNKELIATLVNMPYIGNAFGLYAMFEMGDNLYAVDTHAAHERVLYEKYLKSYQQKAVATQPLMMPIIIPLPSKQIYILSQYNEEVADIGFEIDEFDTGNIAIRSIPYYFAKYDVRPIVTEIADEIVSWQTNDDFSKRSEHLIQIACHNAVRGSSDISENEVRALLKDLYETEMPYTCPHGRPIIGKINQKYFMKMFERI